jgi:DNA polymerase III subunit delta'
MATETPTAAPLPAPSWLGAEMATLAAAFKADRLSHGLLIHEAPGAGGDWLAKWAASLVLCQNVAQAPCGSCRGCHSVATRQHPDLVVLQPIEESKQIRIEQIRELSDELALTSHQGSYKVAVITPADTLNRFAANALLKTLEEPQPRTLLVLVVTQPSRLPPTVLSRCQRLKVPAPTRAQALAWLNQAGGARPWAGALDALGEAPLSVVATDPEEVAAAGSDTQRTLEALAQGSADPVATAERWARADLPLRLRCFENWLTERIRRHEREGAFMTEVRAGPYLSGGRPVLNIRELFRLIDEVRELRATLDVPLNRGVALEVLFRRLAP